MTARQGRYVAVDVHYPTDGGARAGMVAADDVRFAAVTSERVVTLDDVAAYEPGRFSERELPAVRAVLAGEDHLDVVVVDGYVQLDPTGRAGMGAHLHAELRVPVIGVAKTRFRSATHAIEVRRGEARRPLYVTAAGVDADEAAAIVRAMAGPYRLPDALRRVDALSRSGPAR